MWNPETTSGDSLVIALIGNSTYSDRLETVELADEAHTTRTYCRFRGLMRRLLLG